MILSFNTIGVQTVWIQVSYTDIGRHINKLINVS